MSDNQKIIRVFIGSPGGLDEERQAAHEVVDSVNRSHSDHWGLQIRLLGWETAIPGYARPQDKINEDLDKCDYFMGVVWNHWGSKPTVDISGPTSGFEEEYKRAESRINAGLMEDMALYFKTYPAPAGFIPDENLQKVIDFRKQCIEEKKHFFRDFRGTSDFREFVRAKFEEIGWKETEIVQHEHEVLDQTKRIAPQPDKTDNAPEGDTLLISGNARDFVGDLMQRSSEWDSTSPTDIARLRLLGSAFKRSGNDDYYIGTHDANLLFQRFRDSELSAPETRALLDCGIVGFQHQNVPLWTWLVRDDRLTQQWDRVKVLAAFGTNVEMKQAIDILGLLGAAVPSFPDHFDRKRVLRSWLADGVDSSVREAAISFISEHATSEELPLVEEIAAEITAHQRSKVEVGIVGIMSRIDVNAALQRVVEKEVDIIDASLAKALFSSPQSISTETALLCLSAKADPIRLSAVQILSSRNEIALEVAETLLTDSNHEIRLIGAETLREAGNPLNDDVAKKALRIVKPTNGLFGLVTTQPDDTYYERYQDSGLSQLSYNDLFTRLDEASVVNQRALSALLSRHGNKAKVFIRENLNDLFSSYFETRVDRELASERITEAMAREIRSVKELVTSRMCTIALISLSKQESGADLTLVRKVLDGAAVEANEAILRYLEKFGDWSDIERLKNLGEKKTRSLSFLDFPNVQLPYQKASAILGIGKTRVADMLELDLDSEIRVNIAKKLPASVISGLRDEILIRELEKPQNEYRVVFALRCVQSLSKRRLKTLLDRYIDSTGHRYYNSVHWLDLGVALPSGIAKKIAHSVSKRY